jgi:hypothetical protein
MTDKNMEEMLKGIHDRDQMLTFCSSVASMLYSYFEALKKEGFSELMASAMTMDFQDFIFRRSKPE